MPEDRIAKDELSELEWTKRIWKWLDSRDDITLHTGRERQLWDRSRVDVFTDKHAFEVDWAHKWPEAIGQATLYSIYIPDRSAGVILLVGDYKKEARFIYRCQTVCVALGILLWTVDTRKSKIVIGADRFDLPGLVDDET